ncbi:MULTISPECIES: hypothetical protein [unclassified Variovorax]|uniref:hypothetical protein n=1 Tax=unclassified Variovorax TaxID=663243 RepID=UPI0032E723BB
MIRRTKRFRKNLYRLSDVALWLLLALFLALAADALPARGVSQDHHDSDAERATHAHAHAH